MPKLTPITNAEWNETIESLATAQPGVLSAWENALIRALPYVSFEHFRYADSHVVRVATVNGRRTTTPFTDGGDVLAYKDAPLDLEQFQADLQQEFGAVPRLRINEVYAPVSEEEVASVTAYDYLVDLTEPLLPRVRKTLRHILEKPLTGEVRQSTDPAHRAAAYQLYVRHMRSMKNFALPRLLFDDLLGNQGGELWVWLHDGRVEAMAIFIPHKNFVQYSLSAASRVALDHNAPHHLVYAALESYQARGVVQASLGATGIGSALEVFKRGWRGEPKRIITIGANGSAGKSGRGRALLQYVPLVVYPWVTKQLGRYFL